MCSAPRLGLTSFDNLMLELELRETSLTDKGAYVLLDLMNLKRAFVLSSLAIALPILTWLGSRARRVNVLPQTSTSPQKHRTYTTNFSLTEDPISEGDHWIGGLTAGLDWSNIQTTPARAYGTILSSGNYNDPTALLTGSWGPNQTTQATVFSLNQSDAIYEEVELRLRSSLAAHLCTGYEIDFRVSSSPKAYLAIVRWNGALGDFTYLVTYRGSRYGVSNGDVIKASIIGTTIKVYKNDTQIGAATDGTYASGVPGIGMDGPLGTNSNWGFSSFMASD
jgi:hypothetical protein